MFWGWDSQLGFLPQFFVLDNAFMVSITNELFESVIRLQRPIEAVIVIEFIQGDHMLNCSTGMLAFGYMCRTTVHGLIPSRSQGLHLRTKPFLSFLLLIPDGPALDTVPYTMLLVNRQNRG